MGLNPRRRRRGRAWWRGPAIFGAGGGLDDVSGGVQSRPVDRVGGRGSLGGAVTPVGAGGELGGGEPAGTVVSVEESLVPTPCQCHNRLSDL